MTSLVEIPDVSKIKSWFPEHYLKSIFTQDRPVEQSVYVLVSNYIRLTQAAIELYKLGENMTRRFWTTHDSVALGAALMGASYFECCVTNVYRAASHMKKIRANQNVPQALKDKLPRTMSFIGHKQYELLRNVRDAVQHGEGRILAMEQTPGISFTLMPSGPSTETVDSGFQKTIDRLVIERHEIIFSDLAFWLQEMSNGADAISTFQWQ